MFCVFMTPPLHLIESKIDICTSLKYTYIKKNYHKHSLRSPKNVNVFKQNYTYHLRKPKRKTKTTHS